MPFMSNLKFVSAEDARTAFRAYAGQLREVPPEGLVLLHVYPAKGPPPWTSREDYILMAEWLRQPVGLIAETLKRSVSDVRERAAYLGLIEQD